MQIITLKYDILLVFRESELNKLVDESLVMAKFNHLNVMKLIGVSLHIRDSVYIVMPYMTHGSLLSYLRKQRADLTIVGDDNVELVSVVINRFSPCIHIILRAHCVGWRQKWISLIRQKGLWMENK